MNIALWILQGVLAALFLMIGGLKVFNYEKLKAQSGGNAPSRNLATFIGVSEMAGAVGLVLPWATGHVPVLTPVAAAALGVVMILAVVHHLQHHDSVAKTIPAVAFLVLTAVVAWGRA